MLSKDFPNEEIHDFFRTLYDDTGRDYREGVTQAQIESGKNFKNRGGKPHPCTPKNREDGKISIPLHQIFGFDDEQCKGCSRRKVQTKTERQQEKEREIAKLLEELKAKYIFKTPTDLKDLYYYLDGVYVDAESMIEHNLEEKLGPKGYTYFIDEIIKHLKRSSYVERAEFNKYTDFIPVQNGLLNPKTLELKPFNPDQIFTFKLNVKYDRDKDCPKFKKFLTEILPQQEDQNLLQEEMGYAILPEMPKHKIFWWYGSGRNGKGRVMMTLIFIIGSQNCSYLELQEFNGQHRFALAQLYGKLVNVSSEPATTSELQTPLLKKITGEDLLDAEVKCKQKRLTFLNKAKPFVLGNRFPKVTDTSTAFQDRRLILKFPIEFIGKNQIDNIEQTWVADPGEVSGIFNWMLKGLDRLLKNNEFTTTKSSKEADTEFKRVSDPIGAWLDDNCTFNPKKYVGRKLSYENYKAYAYDLGVTPVSDRRFYERLRATPRIYDKYTHRKGETEKRLWMGITLKKDEIVPKVPKVPTLSDCEKKKQKKGNHLQRVVEPGTSGTSGTNFHAAGPPSNKLRCLAPSEGAKKCEGCGNFAVEFEIIMVTGEHLQKCRHCLDDMRVKGFKFELAEEATIP
jgi:putative DNA primase/helicase